MNAFSIIIYAVCGVYMLLNFKHDIQMLQQNSYRIPRYWRWLKSDMTSTWRLVDIALLLLVFSTLLDIRLAAVVVAITCLIKIYLIVRKKYKKPLVLTRRVWRIYSVTAILGIGSFIAVILSAYSASDIWGGYNPGQLSLGYLLIANFLSWAFVIAAVIILIPVEKSINRKYYREASKILRSMPDLTVIGITGSYGKTSTKHYLNRILSEKFDVVMTPGSYNTPMGVIRTVREIMKPYNQIFICEMGAKQKGDIKEICDLVHPDMGIVTAVGPMHLETFKTIENVQATKFELIDSLPPDGFAVVNNDFEFCANRIVDNVETVRYGVANKKNASFTAENIRYTPRGTAFTVVGPEGFSLDLETKLVGECNISNLLAAVIIALHTGVEPAQIQYAVASIEQVEHRLNIKQTPGGLTIIDDAFNSNPSGSRMAVDVLAHFKSGKRIIITPGMIELGDKQFELNRQLGEHIGNNVDIAIIVGRYNRDALTEGIKATDFESGALYEVDSFTEAQTLLTSIMKPGDTVLYENDLPDTFK